MGMLLGGRPVLHHVLVAMAPAVTSILVVSGYQPERVRDLVQSFVENYAPRVPIDVLHNPLYGDGMFTSVVAGLRALPLGVPAFLQPGDSPLVRPETYIQLAQTVSATGSAADTRVFVPTCNGKKGHPVILSANIITKILSSAGEGRQGSLKEALLLFHHVLVEIPDEGVLLDLDTPEDYASLAARIKKNNEINPTNCIDGKCSPKNEKRKHHSTGETG
jgi:CTP:molybdopterin cytidylyltransferase MocA